MVKITTFCIQMLSFCEAGLSTYLFPRPLSEEHQTLKFTSHSSVGSKLCHTCDFLNWNAFLALCTAGLKSNKKLSAHLFEVGSWITLASLHRLCVLLWIMSLSVCVHVCGTMPFLFSHTMVLIARAREMWPVLLVFIRLLLSVFLPGCSSLSLSSPLNYYVCAHSGVTLNPGFNLLSDRRHRKHVCWSDIWQALTLRVGKCNYSNEIKKKRVIYLCTFEATAICSHRV